jgi:hypothetical protein
MRGADPKYLTAGSSSGRLETASMKNRALHEGNCGRGGGHDRRGDTKVVEEMAGFSSTPPDRVLKQTLLSASITPGRGRGHHKRLYGQSPAFILSQRWG